MDKDKEKKKPKATLWGEFGWFVWGVIGIGVLWLWTGGPSRPTAHEGEFIKPAAPLSTGEVYGTYYAGKPTTEKETLELSNTPAEVIRKTETALENFLNQAKLAREVHSSALLAKGLSFDGAAGAGASNPDREYIRVVLSDRANAPVRISGLVVKGLNQTNGFILPKAVNKLLPNEAASKIDVNLTPGGRALITSGISPVGTSFRVNMCTAYLEQANDYTPDLRKDCPEPATELALAGLYNDSSCRAFVEKLPRCEAFQGTFPPTLSNACKTFVTDRLNYRSCVIRHEKDNNFYTNEWRLFLGQRDEIWQNSNEIIKLIDESGKTVDAITY